MSGNHNSGRHPVYLTIERFEKFIENDFQHLQKRVNRIDKFQWIIIGTSLSVLGISLSILLRVVFG